MMTAEKIQEILDKITYKKSWEVKFHMEKEIPYLQVEFEGEDAETGLIEKQKCRKWQLSFFMCTTEIVNTAFKAIQAAEDHETREFFKYKNVRIANPHFSVDDIVNIVKEKLLNEETRALTN